MPYAMRRAQGDILLQLRHPPALSAGSPPYTRTLLHLKLRGRGPACAHTRRVRVDALLVRPIAACGHPAGGLE